MILVKKSCEMFRGFSIWNSRISAYKHNLDTLGVVFANELTITVRCVNARAGKITRLHHEKYRMHKSDIVQIYYVYLWATIFYISMKIKSRMRNLFVISSSLSMTVYECLKLTRCSADCTKFLDWIGTNFFLIWYIEASLIIDWNIFTKLFNKKNL